MNFDFLTYVNKFSLGIKSTQIRLHLDAYANAGFTASLKHKFYFLLFTLIPIPATLSVRGAQSLRTGHCYPLVLGLFCNTEYHVSGGYLVYRVFHAYIHYNSVGFHARFGYNYSYSKVNDQISPFLPLTSLVVVSRMYGRAELSQLGILLIACCCFFLSRK